MMAHRVAVDARALTRATRARGRGDGRHRVVARAGASSAAASLAEGRAMYERGDRMGGYKTFERALEGDTMSIETRGELNYCAMCCVAAFGDVEAAKMYLREMEGCGLAFEDATSDPSRMKMESSALMRNQLKKFAAGEGRSIGAVRREQFERERANEGAGTRSTISGLRDLDVSSDTDESVEAIVKRVGILIALSVVGFAALFNAGMGIMQPGSLPFEEIY